MSVIRKASGDKISFMCPGCGSRHVVHVGDGPGPRWSWNGDMDKPTLSPSVLVRSGHYASHNSGECWCDYNRKHPDDAWVECTICHSFVVDGQIQFLGDCTHKLAGQTVPLVDDEAAQ